MSEAGARASGLVFAVAAKAVTFAVAFAVAATATTAQAQMGGDTRNAAVQGATVQGVIVQLRDASPNVPPALKDKPHLVKSLPDGARWAAVLGAVGLLEGAAAVAADLKAPPTRRSVGGSAQLLSFDRRLTADEARRIVDRLQQHPDVAWAVPNEREQPRQVSPAGAPNPPNDPLFPGVRQQWWLQAVSGSDANDIEMRLRGVPGIQAAWTLHAGSQTVAVLDTGVTSHPELNDRMLPGYDFVSDWDPMRRRGLANDGDGRDPDPSDPGDGVSAQDRANDPARYGDCNLQPSSWHGTIIAGMLAARTNDGSGVASMQWNGRILPVRVAGQCGAEVADVIDGMRWAAGLPVPGVPLNLNPARILNMSFGGTAPCNSAYLQAIADVQAAPGGGAVLIASAGNRWGETSRPSNCKGAIGVAALNRDGFKANYSSFGSSVALSTLGGDDSDGAWGGVLADSGLLTLTNDGEQAPGAAGYTYVYGSSFSAPLVSGVAALMLSLNPALTVDQIKAGLRLSARPHVQSPYLKPCGDENPGRCACTTSTCGAGILDAEQALLYSRDPAVYVAPAATAVVLDNPELSLAASLGPDRPPNAPPVLEQRGGGAVDMPWALALLAGASLLQARASLRGLPTRRHRARRDSLGSFTPREQSRRRKR